MNKKIKPHGESIDLKDALILAACMVDEANAETIANCALSHVAEIEQYDTNHKAIKSLKLLKKEADAFLIACNREFIKIG